MPGLPLISVCMVTYNHENYIRQAIESVLSQEGDFKLELIIGEDHSKDNTRNIIKEYLVEYPNIINLLYQDKNLGMSQNLITTAYACRGKYIAFLDGDDYWCDNHKLAKQLAVFESDPNVVLVHTEYHRYFQKNNLFTKNFQRRKKVKVATGYCYDELMLEATVATVTAMALTKNVHEALNEIGNHIANWQMYDYPIWLYLAVNHKFAYIKEATSVYRVLASSASHSNDTLKQIKFETNVFEIRCFFRGIKSVNEKIAKKILGKHHYSLIKIYTYQNGYMSDFMNSFYSLQKNNDSLLTFIKSIFLFGKKSRTSLRKTVNIKAIT